MTTAAPATTTRLQRLRTRLEEKSLDAILISEPSNRRYLSGFVGTAGYLFVTAQDAILATDFRYVEQAGRQAPGFRIERIRAGSDWLLKLIGELGTRRVGFESDHVTVAQLERLKAALRDASPSPDVQLEPTTGITQELRAVKDPGELALLQRSITIADEAFDEVSERVRPGMTEAQVAWEIELAVRNRGAECISFDTIVGAGPNGALPHHRAAEREIREGEPVVIDMGAQYQGYCSDLTRTICLGLPDDTFRRVYDTVLGAQLTAIENVSAGMTGADCDRLARTVIEAAGFGEEFGHSLGHGVGLEVHESPGMGSTSKDVLQDGMAFTIEPGIYISGWGGVRIEDVVVLENGRARVLSNARKTTP